MASKLSDYTMQFCISIANLRLPGFKPLFIDVKFLVEEREEFAIEPIYFTRLGLVESDYPEADMCG